MINSSYAQLAYAFHPEIILADGAVLVLAYDLIFGRRRALATALVAVTAVTESKVKRRWKE